MHKRQVFNNNKDMLCPVIWHSYYSIITVLCSVSSPRNFLKPSTLVPYSVPFSLSLFLSLSALFIVSDQQRKVHWDRAHKQASTEYSIFLLLCTQMPDGAFGQCWYRFPYQLYHFLFPRRPRKSIVMSHRPFHFPGRASAAERHRRMPHNKQRNTWSWVVSSALCTILFFCCWVWYSKNVNVLLVRLTVWRALGRGTKLWQWGCCCFVCDVFLWEQIIKWWTISWKEVENWVEGEYVTSFIFITHPTQSSVWFQRSKGI